jgi:hypothetical protein
MVMILTTPREIQVSKYLRSSRKLLRPVVDARCRDDGRLLAAVYPLRDEFWVWHLGERYSPEQWCEEAESMIAEPGDPVGETAVTCERDASRSPIGAPADSSARTFPDGIFQIHDPVGVYRSHTLEQILTAYPSGRSSSCIKCRSTYVIDPLAIGYMTGEYVVNRPRKRNIIFPTRVSYCGDQGHNCDEHLTGELPWNIAEACRSVRGMLLSPRKEEYL